MLNSENQIFQYNGSPISFQKGNSVMVNATEMAKPFGKLAKDWLSNKSTKEFISTLSAVRTIPLTDLVVVRQGGNVEQGTWLHEDVAVEFARWLSPTFAIWCNDRIKGDRVIMEIRRCKGCAKQQNPQVYDGDTGR